MLTGKCVVLGVTGGIAAYKACEIASRLRRLGVNVRAVMTRNACEFVSPQTFETLTGNPAMTETFSRAWEIGHISLAKWADACLIAPATANMLGKIANGIADDLLSTTVMALPAPVLIAPAMNQVMWKSAANQQNVRTLAARGYHFVGPAKGQLACGDDDIGRMSEPEEIVRALSQVLLSARDFAGRRVLVTAGPTREMIDPVRFLSNRSSGKMGYALAEAARDRGADVVLVSGPVALEPPVGVEFVPITSTLDLYEAVVSRAGACDAVIQAAAPADFRPKECAPRKIKKTGEGRALELLPNPDIAAQLGRDKRPGQVLVAFAAETDNLVENARGKLARKNCDLVVLNDVTEPGAGFQGDTNRVVLVGRAGEKEVPMMHKREVADRILDETLALLRRSAE